MHTFSAGIGALYQKKPKILLQQKSYAGRAVRCSQVQEHYIIRNIRNYKNKNGSQSNRRTLQGNCEHNITEELYRQIGSIT
jgi:hypothetical protein